MDLVSLVEDIGTVRSVGPFGSLGRGTDKAARGVVGSRRVVTVVLMTTEKEKPRGFAAISPERRAEISRKGGQAAHAKGTAHEFTTEEARSAGRKGGKAVHARRRASQEP